LGAQPYLGKTNSETSDFVLSGKRMEKPEKCPEAIYELMLKCWEEKSKLRPSMREIHESLNKMRKSEFVEEKLDNNKVGYETEYTLTKDLNYETKRIEDNIVEYSTVV
jgi:hypothetical protein